ncbi:hypothetical protein RvY_00438 [Ramazzottius varieornatus]|uniref:Uncharacterized protein n=1 Tax=Ramazzottius varieornatus TaxID=947166 RepID=A0A1D1UCT0_RAMVA|nr:hypothetical protein RvY_00438 [Ramazzottius varieornatus]
MSKVTPDFIFSKDFMSSNNGTFCPSTKPDCNSAAHSGTPTYLSPFGVSIHPGLKSHTIRLLGIPTPGGPAPPGLYQTSNCGRKTESDIYRCNLNPIGHNAMGRTALQVHEPSTNWLRRVTNMDSLGCIVTPDASRVQNGDIVGVGYRGW